MQLVNDGSDCLDRLLARSLIFGTVAVMQEDDGAGLSFFQHAVRDDLGAGVRPVAGNDAPVGWQQAGAFDGADDGPVLEAVRRTHEVQLRAGDSFKRAFAIGDVAAHLVRRELEQVFVIACMQGDEMACALHLAHQLRMLGGVLTDHEEGGVDVLFCEYVEQFLRIGRIGAVVKGEGDDLALRVSVREHLAVEAVAGQDGEQQQHACQRHAESRAAGCGALGEFFVLPQPQQRDAEQGAENEYIDDTHE